MQLLPSRSAGSYLMYLKRVESRLVPVSRSTKRQIVDTWRHIPSRLSVRISSVTGDVFSGAKNVWYTTCAEEWIGRFVSGRLCVRVLRFLNCRKCKNLTVYAGQTLLLSLPSCLIYFTLILFVAFVLSVFHSLCTSFLSSSLFYAPYTSPPS